MNTSLPARLEAEEQEQLFQMAELHRKLYPELNLLYAIPNGGSRHPAEAVNLKKQGVKAGVPDICLPVPRGKYAALYIELKRERGGRPSEEQKAWVRDLNEAGNAAIICKGADIAWNVIVEYLHGNLP